MRPWVIGMLQRTAILLLPLLLATGMPVANAADATVRFATACAKCHEGECSGRLSFSQTPDTTFTHIRQYAGPSDDAFARALYDTLEHMKSRCAYPPIPLAPVAHPLDTAALAAYRDDWNGAYFVPLGRQPKGTYRLTVSLERGGELRVEIIDAVFDPVFDRCIDAADGSLSLQLVLGDSPAHYLRVRPRDAQSIRSLVFERTD